MTIIYLLRSIAKDFIIEKMGVKEPFTTTFQEQYEFMALDINEFIEIDN